jgi:dTDP-4-dehydrorhamnose reductase
MRILVTGSSGFVGKNAVRVLRNKHEVIGLSRKASPETTVVADLMSGYPIGLLEDLNPDAIVHSAALTAVDFCEANPEKARGANVELTLLLRDFAQLRKRKLIYISTDYVFPGETNGYTEESPTKPINVYGKTKLAGEQIVNPLENHLILRPTVIFGKDEGLNFLMQCYRNKVNFRVPRDQISNPTDVRLLVEAIKYGIEDDLRGTYIATGPESINRYVFAQRIAKIFEFSDNGLVPVLTSELNQLAQRPLNNGTNSSKLRSLLPSGQRTLEESLEQIRREF